VAAGAPDRPRQPARRLADKGDAEIETILRGVWDNLGRVAAEIAHLDQYLCG